MGKCDFGVRAENARFLREIVEDITAGVKNPREIVEGAEDYEGFCGGWWKLRSGLRLDLTVWPALSFGEPRGPNHARRRREGVSG
jgi:hypothetical protein